MPYVDAFWLEGADAIGTVDEYSDIDYWLDIVDAYEEQAYEAVENALSELAEISSLDEIAEKTSEAGDWFDALVERVQI